VTFAAFLDPVRCPKYLWIQIEIRRMYIFTGSRVMLISDGKHSFHVSLALAYGD